MSTNCRFGPGETAGVLPTFPLADEQAPLVPLWIRTQPEPHSEPIERMLPPRNRLPVILPVLVSALQNRLQWTRSASSHLSQRCLAFLTRCPTTRQGLPVRGCRVRRPPETAVATLLVGGSSLNPPPVVCRCSGRGPHQCDWDTETHEEGGTRHKEAVLGESTMHTALRHLTARG